MKPSEESRKHGRFDLGNFSLSNMSECGADLRHLSLGVNSLEEAAGLLVNRFRNSFTNPSTRLRSFVLARLFMVVPYGKLDVELQEYVQSVLMKTKATEDMRCLTLLATAGEKPEWNSRVGSSRHKVFPIAGDSFLHQAPMLVQLLGELGLSPGMLIEPDPGLFIERVRRTFKVFYVPEARGSTHIPDQSDFVVPFGIRSVLGFGGVLPFDGLFAVVLFSRDHIPPLTATLFKSLALSVKLAILPFAAGPIFRSLSDRESSKATLSLDRKLEEELEHLKHRIATLELLIEAEDQAVRRQSRRLERTLQQDKDHIAALARSEKDVREQKSLLQSILSSMSDGIAVANEEGRFLEFNSAAERILGIGAVQAATAQWPDKFGLYFPDKSALYPAEQLPLVRAMRGESVDEVELYTTRGDAKDGGWLSVNARPLLDSNGAVKGGVAVFRDITAWKKSMQHVERLYTAVESTDDTVFISGLDGKIEYVNPAFERTTGYSRLEAIGKTPRILKSGHHDHAYYKVLWETILKGNVHRSTTVNRKKNGETFYAEQTITPIRDASGQVTHFVSIIKDMTERRRLQAQEVEMRLAAQVQAKLYPLGPPSLAGCDIASVVLSAEPTCGDCFDFIAMPCGLTSIIIGDVSGHGLGAALVMAETRAYLRALALHEYDPGKLLVATNKMLHADLEDERFVTLFCTQLDIAGRCLVYANAGHPSCFVLDSSGSIRASLDSCGPPLGMFRHSQYACSEKIMLQTGDILVLLTDGILETVNVVDDAFGVEKTLEVIKAHREKSAKEILLQLQEALHNFAGALPRLDDITIVLVKFDAEPMLNGILSNDKSHYAENCIHLPQQPDCAIQGSASVSLDS